MHPARRQRTRHREQVACLGLDHVARESLPARLPDPLPLHAEVAVIQVGADNPYGHPSPEVVGRLNRTGAKVFRNDEHGDVIVIFKEGKVDVAVTKPEAAF